MSQERTKLWYLQNLDLFSHMRKDDYKMVDQHSRMQEIKRGEVLYLEGTPDTNFYLLKKGFIKVSKLLPQGKEIILDIFSGGTVPGLSVRMSKMIEQKRRRVENKLVDLLYRTVEQRIAKTILTLLDDFGVPHTDGLLLNLRLTHKDVADLVASTRETVTMTLNKMKADGLVDFQDKQIIVMSLEKMKALADT